MKKNDNSDKPKKQLPEYYRVERTMIVIAAGIFTIPYNTIMTILPDALDSDLLIAVETTSYAIARKIINNIGDKYDQ